MKKYQIEYIPFDQIDKNSWNPNQETPETYQQLVESVSEEGCDEPILVVKKEDDRYLIIGGAHRYDACLDNQQVDIPCIVKDEDKWRDEVFQRTETVKRNNLRGKLNDQKFTEMINYVIEKEQMSYTEIAMQTGFDNEAELMKHILENKQDLQDELDKYETEKKKDNGSSVQRVDDIKEILNTILEEHGHSLPHGYMWFFHAGQMNLYINTNDNLKATIEKLVDYTNFNPDNNISDIISKGISRELELYDDR